MRENISLKRIVDPNKVSHGKKGFKYLLGRKMLKGSGLYACFFQKWGHIEQTLIKLKICFFDKKWWVIRKIKQNLGKSQK